MFDHTCSCASFAPAHDGLEPLRAYLSAHREALINAATLLAGGRGGRLVEEIADHLAHGDAISRNSRRKMRALLDILALEHVHDPERDEGGCFALLDPASPVVEEICLLTDGYRSALEQADVDRQPPSRPRAAA